MIICVNIVGDSIPNISWSFFYQTGGWAYNAALIRTEQSSQRVGWRGIPVEGQIWANFCRPQWSIADLETDAPNVDALINADYVAGAGRAERKYILVVKIGTNNSETTAAAEAARIRLYCLARQAAGWHVILCPNTSGSLPGTGGAASDTTYIQPLNALFASYGPSDGVERVVSDADAVMYGTGAWADPTYYFDDIHPNETGHARLVAPFKTQLNSLITELGGTTLP